jgi:hypothetical protein
MHEKTAGAIKKWAFDLSGRTFSRAQKLMLLGSIALAVIATVLVGRMLGAPQVRGFSPSLMQNSPAPLGLLTAAAAILAGVAATTLIVGRVRPEAGIFCAALGLLAFRFRTGETGLAMQLGGGRPALVGMAMELGVVGITFVGAFVILRLLVGAGTLPDDADHDGAPMPHEKLDQKLLCTLTTAVVMAVVMMLLCQSDEPFQAMWSVLIASWFATFCAFRFAPVAPGVWYWAAPLVLGVVGYAWTAMNGATFAHIGVPGGFLQSLARPAPLDYASFGVAGALIGYWTGRRHLRDRAEAEKDVAPPSPDQVTYSRG